MTSEDHAPIGDPKTFQQFPAQQPVSAHPTCPHSAPSPAASVPSPGNVPSPSPTPSCPQLMPLCPTAPREAPALEGLLVLGRRSGLSFPTPPAGNDALLPQGLLWEDVASCSLLPPQVGREQGQSPAPWACMSS